MNQDKIYHLEMKLWEAAKNRNSQAFLEVVSETAVMVCGGYRCTGKEYAEIIALFDCESYTIANGASLRSVLRSKTVAMRS